MSNDQMHFNVSFSLVVKVQMRLTAFSTTKGRKVITNIDALNRHSL